MSNEKTATRTGRRLRAIIAIALGALLIAPIAAFAGHQFNDVPNSNIFHDDIDWLADNGVTKGCNPPGNTNFCPDDNVTREQMAAFLRRLETNDVFLPGDSTMVPIARFNITKAGVDDVEFRAPVTGELTGSYASGRWAIDVPGQFISLTSHQVTCTAVGSTPVVLSLTTLSGNLLVHTHALDGADVKGEASCDVYAEAP